MADGEAKTTMSFAILIFLSLFLLCSCTIRVEPIPKHHQTRHSAHHSQLANGMRVKGPKSVGILGVDSQGRTIVTKDWLSRYQQLELKHGIYADDSGEILPTGTPGIYSIGSGVRAHYQDMKKQQVELKEP